MVPRETDKKMKLGRNHALMRRLRSLRRDGVLRRSEGVYLAEGVHLAQEALRSGAEIDSFYVAARLRSTSAGRELLDAIVRGGAPCHETEDATLDAAQDARSPQPVACLVRRPERTAAEVDALLDRRPLAVVLESIQDPGNLGALLRSADGAGCGVAFVTGTSADPYHPRAVRATMGSIFRLPVVERPVVEVVGPLRRRGYVLLGAAPRHGQDYSRADLRGQIALVLGNEGAGISAELTQALDAALTIPLRDGVESLSVGAAGAVLLFEIARQRRR
jgi:TrmH family RNA methyltransferase